MQRYTFTAASGTGTPHTCSAFGATQELARLEAWVELPSGMMRLNPSEHHLTFVSVSDELMLSHEHSGVRLYLGLMLEEEAHAQVLDKLQNKRKPGPERDALWHGYYAMKQKAKEHAIDLRNRGGLLFAWAGTKALNRGAA